MKMGFYEWKWQPFMNGNDSPVLPVHIPECTPGYRYRHEERADICPRLTHLNAQ